MAEGGVPGRRKSTNGSSVVEKSRVLSQARKKPEHRAEGEQDKEGTGGLLEAGPLRAFEAELRILDFFLRTR